MDNRQEAKLNMYRAVEQVCNDNKNVTVANAAYTNAFHEFAGKVNDIIDTATLKKEVISGVTVNKNEEKETLSQSAADMASVLFAYANATDNNILKGQCDYSVSELRRLKDNELPLVCTNIIKAAQSNFDSLSGYGITQDMITKLQLDVAAYSGLVPMTRSAQSVKSTHTENLVELIKDADNILKNQVDKLIVSFKTSEPDFVSSYKNARTIIDPGSRKAKLKPVLVQSIS